MSVTLTVVHSDPTHVRFLSGLNDPGSGVVSVRARPATRRFGEVARLVLAALGIRNDVTGTGRNDIDDIVLASVWLVTNEITDVVVAGAEMLAGPLLDELVRLVDAAGADIHLVGDAALSDQLVDVASRWPGRRLTQDEFDSRWETRRHVPSGPAATVPAAATVVVDPEAARWPSRVPSAVFPVWLAEAHRLLEPADAELVSAQYWETFEAFRADLRALDSISEASIGNLLRSHLAPATTLSRATTIVRAAQAVAFMEWWLIQVDLTGFAAGGDHLIHAVANDNDTWKVLRAYRHPYRGAVCALTAAGLDLATMEELCLQDITDNGTTIDVADQSVTVQPEAGFFLRALRLERLRSGASGGDPLVTRSDGSPVLGRRIAQVLIDAANDLGVDLSTPRTARHTQSPKEWRARHGITIQGIPQ